MRPTKPSLPFQPLYDYVAQRTKLGVNGVNGQGLSAVGWTHDTWQQKMWYRAKAAGRVTEDAADRMAVDLGLHPAEIWGELWWELTAQETPWRVPSLLRLDKALRVARAKDRRAALIPRHTAQDLVEVFDEAFPESLIVKRRRLVLLGEEDDAWIGEKLARRRAASRSAASGVSGRPGIPTQRATPDREQVPA